eukprot:4020977-Amphidinium_carterae.1
MAALSWRNIGPLVNSITESIVGGSPPQHEHAAVHQPEVPRPQGCIFCCTPLIVPADSFLPFLFVFNCYRFLARSHFGSRHVRPAGLLTGGRAGRCLGFLFRYLLLKQPSKKDVAEDAVGRQACARECAATQQRQWQRSTQG